MVLFDFNNYICKTCFSIDYEEEQEEDQEEDQDSRIWTRKKNGQSTKFSLDNLPVKLLTLVFKKMDQRSFVRMRRTNKKMSEFIQTYRDGLRFSLFHLSRITFHPSKDDPDDAQVSFSCPPQNFEEAKDMDMNFAIYESLEGFEKTDFDQFTGMVKTEIRHHDYNDDDRDILGLPMVTISLKQWKNCADLQRELIGVYHHTRITFGRFLSVTAIELVCEFINFAGLKGNKLEVRSISDEILSVLCEKSEAIGLLDRNSRHSQELFMQNGFQTLKELTLLECPVVPKYSQLPNLETIYISVDMRSFNDDTKDSYGQIFECVNKGKMVKWR